MIRLINTPLRMCSGIGIYAYWSVTGISLVIMTWNITWKHFFKDQQLFSLEHIQDLF